MVSSIDSSAQAATSLLTSLSVSAEVLTDSESLAFKNSMKRWSDSSISAPSAILLPTTESDILKIVEYAVTTKIPFVAKSGGHSPWSRIAAPGWIIDLTLFNGLTIDTQNQTATIQAGVGTKQVNAAVSPAGFCIQSPSDSSVGYIPFLLGGGNTWLSGMYGLAIDNLLSARVVTASKGLVTASATENPDLFWALKGAGQFFGLVTEVTVQIYPMEQKITTWTCIFKAEQIKDVAEVVEKLANGLDSAKSPGMAGVMAPPGQAKPMILVSTMHFRPGSEADAVVAPLLALNPVQKFRKEIDFINITDAADAFNTQGGFKVQISCGMQTFAVEKFERALAVFEDLAENWPSAAQSALFFNWASNQATTDREVPSGGSAYSHRDCRVWSMMFIVNDDEQAARAASDKGIAFVEMCQADQKEEEKALFPNHTRTMSLEQRYRGEERRERLAKLKRVWDPEGDFTSAFL